MERRSPMNKLWGKVNGNIWRQKTRLKTGKKTNPKAWLDKFFINLVCSVHTGEYLPSGFSHKPDSGFHRPV